VLVTPMHFFVAATLRRGRLSATLWTGDNSSVAGPASHRACWYATKRACESSSRRHAERIENAPIRTRRQSGLRDE
jgi:LmbE family N-acetylglucosaminyl deacetylase